MKTRNILSILTAILFITLTSCEKVVDVKLRDGEALPYADAWITDAPGEQHIGLYKAVNYLSTTTPQPITDAQVILTDITATKTYTFTYANGKYSYNPGANQRIGFINHQYKLQIVYNGEQYEAYDRMNLIIPIDSITYEYKKAENGSKEGYEAEFHAIDSAGQTDYYWIRTYLNGKRNRHVAEMASIDGSFYENISDGFEFIPPFTKGISNMEYPYKKGDKIRVLLRSLSKESYNFVEQAADQLESDGMFDKVPENLKTNLRNINPASKNKLLGWFGTSAESSLEVEIK